MKAPLSTSQPTQVCITTAYLSQPVLLMQQLYRVRWLVTTALAVVVTSVVIIIITIIITIVIIVTH